MAILPFRNRVSALQGGQGTQQIQSSTHRPETISMAPNLPVTEGEQGVVHAIQARAIRLDGPPQSARGHAFPETLHPRPSNGHDLLNLPNQETPRFIDLRRQLDDIRRD